MNQAFSSRSVLHKPCYILQDPCMISTTQISVKIISAPMFHIRLALAYRKVVFDIQLQKETDLLALITHWVSHPLLIWNTKSDPNSFREIVFSCGQTKKVSTKHTAAVVPLFQALSHVSLVAAPNVSLTAHLWSSSKMC